MAVASLVVVTGCEGLLDLEDLDFAGDPGGSAGTAGMPETPETVIHVSRDGEDTTDCGSLEDPCLTLRTAVDKAPLHATVMVGPGEYAEEPLLVVRPLTIVGAGASSTSLRASDPDREGDIGVLYALSVLAPVSVVVRGLRFVGPGEAFFCGDAGATCVLEDGRVTGVDGGVTSLGALTLRRVRFDGNRGTAVLSARSLLVQDSTFESNFGEGLDCVLALDTSTVTVERTTFSNNDYSDRSLVWLSPDTRGELVNVTASGNTVDSVVTASTRGRLAIRYSTIVENTTERAAVAIAPQDVVVSLEGTLLAANTVNCSHVGLTPRSLGYNLSDDFSCDFLDTTGDQQGGEPMLGPLSDNGGPTLTHALLAGSAAIETGGIGCPEVDQRGVLRRQPATGPKCDVGAFELERDP